ncbi:MAG: class I SAM-dependent methyltransferase [Syntrophaceae bacterium]|nr:class I SAM-dependent methyltransferase [Syntrophaceae bacterium]
MRSSRIRTVLIGLAVLSLWACSSAGHDPPGESPGLLDILLEWRGAFSDVPFVVTPYEIADQMIRMAGVTADDVVYDLGCGDGRLVIEAVRRTGCRGVGVDIDPARIRESRANAKAAGVEDRVRFEQQNFFDTDLREATVVLIYLLPEINIRLRPKFLEEMRPGSRLVSHAFDMGNWTPDDRALVGLRGVYLWVIPANVTGDWTWTPAEGAGVEHTLRIRQDFQRIRGELIRPGGRTAIADAQLTGDRISFAVEDEIGGVPVRVHYAGVVAGNTITGTVGAEGGVRGQRARWHAVRNAATARPVDAGPRISELRWD